MNQANEEALGEVLAWAKAGGEFVAEQAPEVAQEIILWGLAGGLLDVAIGLGVIYFGRLCWKWGRRAFKANTDESELVAFLCYACGVLFGLVGLFIAGPGLTTILKTLVAPKLHVLQALGDLI